MKLHLWRPAPPGHLQPAKIISLGTAVECASIKQHLQPATKAEDRSPISQSDVSLMSDKDHRYILEISWRPCTTIYVNVGTEFGPIFSLEVGKGNTFQ